MLREPLWRSGLSLETMLSLLSLTAGIVLMTISSDKAVEHSAVVAYSLGMSPLFVGVILVSFGTDLPEIANSIISSSLGHGNINVGDSIGSVLTQLTLVLGLLPFLGKVFKVKKREIAVLGACEVLSLLLAVLILEKGFVSRIDALFLVSSWFVYVVISRFTITRSRKKEHRNKSSKGSVFRHLALAVLGFIGVTVGAYIVVESVLSISRVFRLSEYIVSFFLVAIGTSLPELAVDLTAIRKGEYELAVGDAIGSCIMDASFSVGIGLLFFPQAVSGELATFTTVYTILASVIVISILAFRGRLDKKAGVIFLAIYVLSYLLILA
ncbi:sodium:calcium antiporter [Candidatus Bathyarchaeota archaeon]|nr:sodium:calcium antiporter [Candidatus Bathyarchaeota archaeon]